MGARESIRSVVALFLAFRERNTWTQAALARRLGVHSKTAGKWLVAFQEEGVPLEPEKDHPHVYWSIPRRWYPEGILLEPELVRDLYEQLGHAPKSRTRDAAIAKLEGLPIPRSSIAPWNPGAFSHQEEQALQTLEDALATAQSVKLSYASTQSGMAERLISVAHIAVGFPVRFAALERGVPKLKWFRLDGIVSVERSEEPAEPIDPVALKRLLDESIAGYHDGSDPLEHVFFVRQPDAQWVKNSLIPPMRVERVDGGIIVRAKVSGVVQVARFVVGLGTSARALNPELQEAVRTLAEAALSQLEGAEPKGTNNVP